MAKKVFIVVPAYNEEKTIAGVLKGLKNAGFRDIVVVDDGSIDKTYNLAKKESVMLYRHVLNRGLGGALGTGIKAALANNADIIVTFDSDGQHNPLDIKNVIKPITKKKADVVIGSRLLEPKGMPWYRVVGNKIGNLVTFVLFRVKVSDSQSGLRAFSRKAAEKIEIKTNRMEVSSEIIAEIKKKKLKLKEVPINVIYTKYSLSKGQGFFVGLKTLFKLILRKIMH